VICAVLFSASAASFWASDRRVDLPNVLTFNAVLSIVTILMPTGWGRGFLRRK
jgi:hypothetical protein